MLDSVIYSVNELRRDPEERLSEYLQRCVQEHYAENPQQRLIDLGINEETMNVVRF